MGRHSAPGDDEEDGDVLVAAPVVAAAARRGRHARPEDDEETEPSRPADTAPRTTLLKRAVSSAARADARAPRTGKGNQSTAADLELLRERSDVRARVIAGAVAPFVVYTAVMFIAGGWDRYFIWVWVPLVTGGVLAGSILDAAHRKRERSGKAGQGTTRPSDKAP
jgi:hypothetical protein